MRAPPKHPRSSATPASARRREHVIVQRRVADTISIGSSTAGRSLPRKTTSPTVERIKRPSNAFFLYRSEMCKELRALGDQKDVSKVVGQMWRALSPAEKQPWKDRAEEEKRKHSEQNPTYKFKPKPKAPTVSRTTFSNDPRCTELFKIIAAGTNEGRDMSAYMEQVDLVKAENRARIALEANLAARESESSATPPTDFSSPPTVASSSPTVTSSPLTSASDLMPMSLDYPYVAQGPALYAPIPILGYDQLIATTVSRVPESIAGVHAYSQYSAPYNMVSTKCVEPYFPTAYVPDFLPQYAEGNNVGHFFHTTADVFPWDSQPPPPSSQDLNVFPIDVDDFISQMEWGQ